MNSDDVKITVDCSNGIKINPNVSVDVVNEKIRVCIELELKKSEKHYPPSTQKMFNILPEHVDVE